LATGASAHFDHRRNYGTFVTDTLNFKVTVKKLKKWKCVKQSKLHKVTIQVFY